MDQLKNDPNLNRNRFLFCTRPKFQNSYAGRTIHSLLILFLMCSYQRRETVFQYSVVCDHGHLSAVYSMDIYPKFSCRKVGDHCHFFFVILFSFTQQLHAHPTLIRSVGDIFITVKSSNIMMFVLQFFLHIVRLTSQLLMLDCFLEYIYTPLICGLDTEPSVQQPFCEGINKRTCYLDLLVLTVTILWYLPLFCKLILCSRRY